jgi:hypothetical protein
MNQRCRELLHNIPFDVDECTDAGAGINQWLGELRLAVELGWDGESDRVKAQQVAEAAFLDAARAFADFEIDTTSAPLGGDWPEAAFVSVASVEACVEAYLRANIASPSAPIQPRMIFLQHRFTQARKADKASKGA